VKVRFAAPALLEFEAIADWVARDNPMRAFSFVEELRKACLDIGRRPRAYPFFEPRRADGVRRRVHGNYLIFYRIGSDAVEILHVLHGARDYEQIVFPREPN
jgi:plasmid stabilization system protein ParE